MQAFAWSPAYETGVALVDAQHRRLVELINEFGEAVAESLAADRIELTFQALAQYAQTHFADEEALMQRAGIDPRSFEEHSHAHRDFLVEVGRMRSAGGADEGPRVLMKFLVSWLAFHILGTDQKMARQLALIAQGASAPEAYEQGARREDASARLLLGAVDDLLRVLVVRNQQLSQANATLEQRVAERTQELALALAELKSAQQAAIENAKLASVGQLASGLAHEINNPLAFLGPNLDYLADSTARLLDLVGEYQRAEPLVADAPLRVKLSAQRERAQLPALRAELPALLEETTGGLARVKAIVRDMRAFSGLDRAGLTPTDLDRCLDTVWAVVPAALKDGVAVAREDGKPEPVRCVAAQLNQAVLALVTNALQAVRDAAPRSAAVTLRTGQEGEVAWVEVEDTGVGMGPEVRAHLFEPFYTTRPPGQGYGLGLSAAWKFARAHGGSLAVESEAGKGTRARLTLPRAGPTELPEPELPGSSYNQRRRLR